MWSGIDFFYHAKLTSGDLYSTALSMATFNKKPSKSSNFTCYLIHIHLIDDSFFGLQPPKELLIQIRVLVPCGEIMTEYGPVNLSLKGSEQFVRR
jgi:hypothetical protein